MAERLWMDTLWKARRLLFFCRERRVLTKSREGTRMVKLTLAFIAVIAIHSIAVADTAVERGSYLVNTIMTCGNCHTPKGPPAAVAGKDFSGGLTWDEPPFKVTAPNITPDKDTGIGSWTDTQIKTMLLTGKNPHGVQEAEAIPTAYYPILTPDDLDAIVAFLRSLT